MMGISQRLLPRIVTADAIKFILQLHWHCWCGIPGSSRRSAGTGCSSEANHWMRRANAMPLSDYIFLLPPNGRRRTLAPYIHLIVALRLQGVAWAAIQGWLNERYGIAVSSRSIARYFSRIEASGKLESLSGDQRQALFDSLKTPSSAAPASKSDHYLQQSHVSRVLRVPEHAQTTAPVTPTSRAPPLTRPTAAASDSGQERGAVGGLSRANRRPRLDPRSPEFMAAMNAIGKIHVSARASQPPMNPPTPQQPETEED